VGTFADAMQRLTVSSIDRWIDYDRPVNSREPTSSRSAPRTGWSLEGTTLYYREGEIELYWRMPDGFSLPSNALLSLAEAVLFAPYGRKVEIEPARRDYARRSGRVAVAYSGGVDSTAAVQLLPGALPIYTQVEAAGLHVLENALLAVEEVGGIAIESNYDILPLAFDRRKGFFGFAGFTVTSILLADHLNIHTVADGNIIDAMYLAGPHGHGTKYKRVDRTSELAMFERAGLRYCAPCAGLTEVSTDRIARGFKYAMGCMRGSGGKPCLNCMKCFRKGAIRGELIPSNPETEKVLAKDPIKAVCGLLWAVENRGLSHPMLDRLKKDISWVDKWYPRSIEFIPIDLRDRFREQLAAYQIEPLADVTPVETWDARRSDTETTVERRTNTATNTTARNAAVPMSRLIESVGDSIIVTWTDELADFFSDRKIYLEYPWKVNGVYKPGERIRIHRTAVVEPYTSQAKGRVVSLGAFSYCRTRNIAPDFRVGRYCSVATGVSLSEQEHPLDRISTHPFTTHKHMVDLAKSEFNSDITIFRHQFTLPAPSIGHDVWIGEGAVIKRGISVGTGAVIAARAYVTKDVPPYAIVGGVPARVIRHRFDEATREALLASEWWRYRYTDLPRIDPRDIDGFLGALSELRASGNILEYQPPLIEVVPELLAFMEHRT